MFLRSIKAENLKLKRSFIWMAFILIPCIPAIMGTFNYVQNQDILKAEWYSLWTQHTLFYANFFYGPLIALYCSYLWRLEHLNNNWNALMTTPIPISYVFLSKLAVAFKVTIMTQIWVGILYFICGKLVGLPGIIPFQIVGWLIRGSIGGVVIAALQLLLSMRIRSFSMPIAMALIGSILGLLISNMGKGMFWPYSLMMLGMNANKYQDMMVGKGLQFIISVTVYLVFIIVISIRKLKRDDIRTT